MLSGGALGLATVTQSPQLPLPWNLSTDFIIPSIHNKKAHNTPTFSLRHNEVFSDPNNLFVPRCPHAGKVVSIDSAQFAVMHNGILVSEHGYYGAFSNMLKTNRGVHEPGEERIFAEVLKRLPEGASMVELGSYWAYYSIWFAKELAKSSSICVEAIASHLEVGRDNARANGVHLKFIKGKVGSASMGGTVKVEKLFEMTEELSLKRLGQRRGKVDLLLMDIQGHEVRLLQEMEQYLLQRRVEYLFISTHSQRKHAEVLGFLRSKGYRIIGSSDLTTQTFSFDGVVIAVHASNTDVPEVELGSRAHTPIRETMFSSVPTVPTCKYLPDAALRNLTANGS